MQPRPYERIPDGDLVYDWGLNRPNQESGLEESSEGMRRKPLDELQYRGIRDPGLRRFWRFWMGWVILSPSSGVGMET